MVLIDRTKGIAASFVDPEQESGKVSASGETVLHYAAEYWDGGVISKLLEKGADIEARSIYGETALHFAAYSRNISTLQILLKKGADVNIRNIIGWTSLHAAARKQDGFEPSIKAIEMLLEANSEVDAQTKIG